MAAMRKFDTEKKTKKQRVGNIDVRSMARGSILLSVFLISMTVASVAEAGKVMVFRTQSSAGYYVPLHIHINGKKVGVIKSGKVLRASGSGGRNKIKVTTHGVLGSDSRTLTFTAKPGGNYFSVGWKDHIIAPYFHFEEVTRASFNRAKRAQEKFRKEFFDADPFKQ